MKQSVTIAIVLGLASVGVGLALVNPDSADYEEFAARQLTLYLKENVCPQAPSVLGRPLKAECATFVDANRLHFKQLIARNTQRQNFLIFSIYKTQLTVSSLLPSYQFDTIAGFNQFYIYKVEQY